MMMEIFDPIDERRLLDGDVGYRWSLDRPFADTTHIDVVTSSARFDLNLAVQCILVGYDEPAQALVARAFEWLSGPLSYAELGPDDIAGADADRHLNLALCTWFLTGEHDVENYTRYVACYEAFLPGSGVARHKPGIGLTLPQYVDAHAYETALARFDYARMTPPASLARIRSEGQMSYLLCRHYLYREYDPAELDRTIRKFLKANVNGWLIDGHYLRAAEWMKIAHWSGEASLPSVRDTVLACYDYLEAPRPTD